MGKTQIKFVAVAIKIIRLFIAHEWIT